MSKSSHIGMNSHPPLIPPLSALRRIPASGGSQRRRRGEKEEKHLVPRPLGPACTAGREKVG